MAMEEEDNNTAVPAINIRADIKKGGDAGDNGACIDRQPDTVVHQAGLNRTAGRGSRSGPGAHSATGIRVLKAGHNGRVCAPVIHWVNPAAQSAGDGERFAS